MPVIHTDRLASLMPTIIAHELLPAECDATQHIPQFPETTLGSQVLIVSPQLMLGERLARYLQDCGYRTWIAHSSHEAYKSYISHHPDVILVVEGKIERAVFPLTHWLSVYVGRTPIILLSPLRTAEARRRGLLSGANTFITYPVDLSIIEAQVAICLRRQTSLNTRPDDILSEGAQRMDRMA
jgi:DNA-binding response OmpR family regulator